MALPPNFNSGIFSKISAISRGHHSTPSSGMSFLEACAHVTGEPFNDRPRNVCPVISAFMRTWNDGLPDSQRTKLLVVLVPGVLNSNTQDPAIESARAAKIVEWLQKEFVPFWVAQAGIPHTSNLIAMKQAADKRWDQVSAAFRSASESLARSKAADGLAASGLFAGIIGAKSVDWSPEKGEALRLIEGIALPCARTASKMAARKAAEAAGVDSGGKSQGVIDRQRSAADQWLSFDEVVVELQRSARSMIRQLAKVH